MRLPVLVYVLAGLTGLSAQAPGPSPVRYTEAREYTVRRQVQLPGSVDSPTVSTVAGEVAGLVVELAVREGDAVETGQVLARLRTRNLELQQQASQSELKEEEARLKLAERNLERAQELFDSKVFSQQELDDAFFEFSAWQGRLDRLRAEIERILDDIERCTIHAPFNGVVTDKHTELGQWLAVGDPVVELMAVDDLRVLVQVPERYYRGLRVGSRVAVEFEAIGGRKTVGTVTAIIPRADAQARTFPVKLKFPNPGGKVAAGMLAQVAFSGGDAYRATIVPKDAVVSQNPHKVIYVIKDDGTVDPIRVRTAAGVGSWIEVSGNVRPGQRVVTRGNERLMPGQAVQGEPIEYKLP